MSQRVFVAFGLLMALAPSAQGEVFVFHDDARGEARGKVLAEFDEMLFVALDGQEPEFIYRAQLAAIVDDEGQRHETLARGHFAPLSPLAPVAAVTDVVGEAWVAGSGLAPAPVTKPPVFIERSSELSTGDAGFARAVLPSGSSLKLSPDSELRLVSARGGETVRLNAGEAFVQTRLRPLDLELPQPLRGRLERGSKITLRKADAALHVQQHKGRTSVESARLRFVVEAGQGLELRQLTEASWRLTADPANSAPVELHTDGQRKRLQPGDSHVFGSSSQPEGDLWRLLVSKGELRVRKGNNAPFSPLLDDQRDRLVVGPGDGVRTAAKGGSATLVRVSDGGTLTLHPGTTIELNGHTILRRGKMTVEALEGEIPVLTSTGVAGIRMCVVELERAPRGSAFEVRAVAGKPELPVGPLTRLVMEQSSAARLTAPARVQLSAGKASLHSRSASPERDPEFKVRLSAGSWVGVRQKGSNPVLDLPGGRVLEFAGAQIQATVELGDEPRCVFPSGAKVELEEELKLALANDGGRPQLRFVKGPTLTLEDPFDVRVLNPTVVLRLPDREVRVKLEGDVQARLLKGGSHSVAALGLRDDDYLEVSGAEDVSVDRHRDLHRFQFGDGRKLWIQDGAPAVQSRFSDDTGTAFLTMAAVPALGLSGDRNVTVLATRDGEFIILDKDRVDREQVDLLAGPGATPVIETNREPIPNLLEQPPAASPSGP